MSWQPIETAPKDGTAVDVWCNGCRYPDAEFRFEVEWDEDGGEQGWCHNLSDYETVRWWLIDPQPTHWMPLPEPPNG